MAFPGAERFLPDSHDLGDLVEAARTCRGCDLYKAADQTVFGAGSPGSTIMFVGEQPGGDQEDRAGKPFVGPAGGGCSIVPSTPPRSIANSPTSPTR